MDHSTIIKGDTEVAVWQQIMTELDAADEIYDYHVTIEQGPYHIVFDIDIDLGGGFEGGYSTTSFLAQLPGHNGFKFSVHDDSLIDEIGKFFGLQDIKTGYPKLDHHLIIKTNDTSKIKLMFADDMVREVFESLKDFDFGIRMHYEEGDHEKRAFLELNIADVITGASELQKIYSAFFKVLVLVQG